ncbi:hypothetical protein AB4305_24205 [Nocardia sp. 2YAB30]|uniref:hypothetical protein n=1 Tax=unclassified Nocardia TaxID=2637762 RepID=UPI003F9518EC
MTKPTPTIAARQRPGHLPHFGKHAWRNTQPWNSLADIDDAVVDVHPCMPRDDRFGAGISY